jgi:solute carrier family 25, member 34/35
VRLQSQSSKVSVGHQHAYKGMLDGFAQVIRAEGVLGLMRGVSGAVPRLVVGSAVQLSTYDQSKQLVLKAGLGDHIGSHLLASMISGVLVSVAMNPFDVVSTRLYNQDAAKPLYSGPVNCLVRTARSEGIRGLYKGFGAQYFRVGPHTVFTFLFWEQLKRMATQAGL